MSASRRQRRKSQRITGREERRLALQWTAELWRGLQVVEMEIQLGLNADALATIGQLRALVHAADESLVSFLRSQPLNGFGEAS